MALRTIPPGKREEKKRVNCYVGRGKRGIVLNLLYESNRKRSQIFIIAGEEGGDHFSLFSWKKKGNVGGSKNSFRKRGEELKTLYFKKRFSKYQEKSFQDAPKRRGEKRERGDPHLKAALRIHDLRKEKRRQSRVCVARKGKASTRKMLSA